MMTYVLFHLILSLPYIRHFQRGLSHIYIYPQKLEKRCKIHSFLSNSNVTNHITKAIENMTIQERIKKVQYKIENITRNMYRMDGI